MAEIANIIKKIATEGQKIHTYPAKVIRVNRDENALHPEDEDAYSVDVMRADGAEISHVRLKASLQDKEQGIICIPKVGSWVLASIIETTETRAFISQYSEIDKIFLRIRNDDDTYFQMQTGGNESRLSFKRLESEGNPITNTPPLFKDISSIGYSSDEVKIDFSEGQGYQAVIQDESIVFNHEAKGLNFAMGDKFKVEVGENNLKDQLNDLITEISKIVVAQGVSPDVGALADINAKINEIME
ncbi:hypothetical protein D1816_04795 [Aquimarina sp. AD10]|uniref:hypothetical protein n=1 Tax=Aquimarina TaxID=290174 RepID=UPI000E47AA2F|nr:MULTISPECIES: hypothetical protein [Aquimarina]AXT59701.1 hypothetical protein D1816_04795 [Aquimarina sp. AD10]RKM97577.1 hypothetical protein D7033_14375 [Aquimarina sp. AD10]